MIKSGLEKGGVNGIWTLPDFDQSKHQVGNLDNWSLSATQGAIHLANGMLVQKASGEKTLTGMQLAGIVDGVTQRWVESGLLSSEQLAVLKNINIEIVDLPGTTLGQATADTIYIDSNAAGYGWFVNATANDAVFVNGVNLDAKDSEAFGRIDLQTVLMREIGHSLSLVQTEPNEAQ